MSGQRIAAVIGLAVLTLFFASVGVLSFAAKVCTPPGFFQLQPGGLLQPA